MIPVQIKRIGAIWTVKNYRGTFEAWSLEKAIEIAIKLIERQ